jgi:phospholipase C
MTVVAGLVVSGLVGLATTAGARPNVAAASATTATTPIKHVVVIFGENISFDHYFGTYRPVDHGPYGAQTVNGLFNTPGAGGTGTLLSNNPNLDLVSGKPANPRQLDPTNVNDILTCDQDHGYTDEEAAFDAGKMDNFPNISKAAEASSNDNGQPCSPDDVMNYYAGDSVTAMWNYANHFALNDNSFGTTFGPSAPGAINLASGDTGGVDTGHEVNAPPVATTAANAHSADVVSDGSATGQSLVGDAQPYWDDCSTRDAVGMNGKNIGDLLNAQGLSWGWFEGGFRPTTSYFTAGGTTPTTVGTPIPFLPNQFLKPGATAGAGQTVIPASALPPGASFQGLCNAVHPIGPSVGGIGGTAGGGAGQYGWKDDYIPHHEPFQFYPGTANPHHIAPTSLNTIGTDTQTGYGGPISGLAFDTANHNYDTSDFDALVGAITRGALPPTALPAVSFLKAPGYQDAHAQYSDPLDEQQFLVKEINALQHSPDWSSTAVFLAYDDSDGFYDHVFAGMNPGATNLIVQNGSISPADTLSSGYVPVTGSGGGDGTATGFCGGSSGTAPTFSTQQGRCGYGPRLPFLVVSPYAKRGLVDHTLTDQSSIIGFVMDNWGIARSSLPGSAVATAGSVANMFDFGHRPDNQLFLDPTTGRESATERETIQQHKA